MGKLNKMMLALGGGAVLTLSVAPAMAAVHGQRGETVLEQSNDYRGWGRHHRHRNRVDGGDILTGVAILAGIAILADAASKSDRKERDEQYEPRYPSDDNRPQGDYDNRQGSDVGVAVQACSAAAEGQAGNGAEVSEVRSASRDGAGWRVEGDLSGGGRFTCRVIDGHVDIVEIDDGN